MLSLTLKRGNACVNFRTVIYNPKRERKYFGLPHLPSLSFRDSRSRCNWLSKCFCISSGLVKTWKANLRSSSKSSSSVSASSNHCGFRNSSLLEAETEELLEESRRARDWKKNGDEKGNLDFQPSGASIRSLRYHGEQRALFLNRVRVCILAKMYL